MRIKVVLYLLFYYITVTTGFGQNIEPIELTKMIFYEDTTIDVNIYSIGEFKNNKLIPHSRNVLKGVAVDFNLLYHTEKKAIVGMILMDSTGLLGEFYFHLKKDSIWKLEAFRFQGTDNTTEKLKALENLTSTQKAEIIATEAFSDSYITAFKSLEEYEYLIKKNKLLLASNSVIEQHFFNNEAAFEQLKDLALQQLKEAKLNQEKCDTLIISYTPDYRLLLIHSVYTGHYYWDDIINFSIGDFRDIHVGYMYVEDQKYLPDLDASGIFIMIKEIGNGWFMYRTR